MRYLLVLSLLFLAGCGGGSAPASNGPPIFNIPNVGNTRLGTWSGRTIDNSLNKTRGTLTLNILADKSINGRWLNDNGVSWGVNGHSVDDDIATHTYGLIDLNFASAGMDDLHGEGQLLVQTNDHLAGHLTVRNTVFAVPVHYEFTVDLTRQ